MNFKFQFSNLKFMALAIFLLAVGMLCLQAQGLESLPPALESVLGRAEALLEKNNPAEAVRVLKAAEAKGFHHPLLYYTLGNGYMMNRQARLAKDAYLKSVQADGTFAPAWFNLASSCMDLEQWVPAGEAFVKAYETDEEKTPEALYYAASAYLAGDKPRKALDLFKRLQSLHPDRIKTDWLETLVQILLADGKDQEAVPVMEKLCQDLSGDKKRQWQEYLLQHYLALKRESEALALAEALTREEPREPKWWKGLIHVNLALERYPEALAVFDIYGRLFDLTPEEKKLLADLFQMADLPDRSIPILEELLRQSYDLDLVEKLVQGYVAMNRPEGALPWIERGLKKYPNDARLFLARGEAQFQARDYKGALESLQNAVKRNRNTGRAWLLLGYAAWYAEDQATALAAMKEAVRFPGQKKQALEALAELNRSLQGSSGP